MQAPKAELRILALTVERLGPNKADHLTGVDDEGGVADLAVALGEVGPASSSVNRYTTRMFHSSVDLKSTSPARTRSGSYDSTSVVSG